MKVIIKIDLDKGTNELIVKNELKEWLANTFWKGNLAEITIENE